MEVKFVKEFATTYSHKTRVPKSSNPTRPKDAKKSQFVVKVQVALGVYKGEMMIYNKDRSCEGGIVSTHAIHEPLYKSITTKGVAGAKGYFRAMIKDGKLMINPFEIQCPEPW